MGFVVMSPHIASLVLVFPIPFLLCIQVLPVCLIRISVL